jgi:hypothetical protein
MACSLAVGLVIAVAATGSAQQNQKVRVCVNLETATLGGDINNFQRNKPTLVRAQIASLNEHKPDKKHHFVLDAIAVPDLGTPPSGIPGRSPYEKYGRQLTDADLKLAQEKACDYILFSLVWNSAAAMGELPHTSLSPSYGGDTYPQSQASVVYRLHQLNPRAPVVEASVFTHDTGPPAGLVLRALDLVATQVFDKIAKNMTVSANTP